MNIIPFDFREISKVKRGEFLGGSFIHNSCQSMCYDSRNRKYIIGFAEPGGSTAVLIRTKDLSFEDNSVDLIVKGLPLNHCNDLAYCPDDHKIYAVGGNWWVAVIDPGNLQIERKIAIDMATWSIARYPNGDWFLHDGVRGARYSHDFKLAYNVSLNDREIIIGALHIPYRPERGDYAGCWQGAICIGETPYMMYNEFSAETGKPISFALMSCKNSNDRDIYQAKTDCEVESADIVNRKMKLVYGQTYRYGGSEWDMSEDFMKTIYMELGPINIMKRKEIYLNLSKYVPEGYQLASANAQLVRCNNTVRSLPYIMDDRCLLRINKINNNKIYLKTGDVVFEDISFQITGFCKKVNK